MAEWFYSTNGESIGPVTVAALRDLALSNTITKDTMVWNPKLGKEWERFDSAKVEVAEFLESEITKALVGSKYEYYLARWQKITHRCNYDIARALMVPSWNWPALFISCIWASYRRLYWAAGVLLPFLIFPDISLVTDLIAVVLWIATATLGNSYYLQQTHKKWLILRNLPSEEACKVAAAEGGESWKSALAVTVVMVLCSVLANVD